MVHALARFAPTAVGAIAGLCLVCIVIFGKGK
jgi:hypothetical protein